MQAFVFIAIMAVLPPVPGKITPDLVAILDNMQPDAKLIVIVQMNTEYPYEYLEAMSSQEKCVVFKEIADNSQRDVVQYLNSLPGEKAEMGGQFWIFNGFHLKATRDVIKELTKRDDIWFIGQNGLIKLDVVPGEDVESRLAEWNVLKVCADSCWNAGFDGTGVIVGHVDTGVEVTHPALNGKWVSPYWLDGVSGQPAPYDDYGHGTHTMGTICGGDGPGPFVDDVGVAYGARFIPTKAFDAGGSGEYAWIDTCMQYLANLKAGGVDIRAIGNSWGTNTSTDLHWWTIVLNWKNLGILPVFSNGNNGPQVGSPASYPTTIGVGATDASDNIASFSNPGPAPNQSPWNDPLYWYYSTWNLLKPDVSAPGVNVRSSMPGSTYGVMSGTSMASPHVTGGTAVLLQKNANLTVTDLYDLFRLYCDQPSQGAPYPNYNYGWGRINLWRSLQNTPASNQPNVVLNRTQVVNDNNGNGKLDPGETAGIITYLRNTGSQPATNVQGKLRTTCPYVTINDSLYSYGTMNAGDSANNLSDAYDIFVSSSTPEGTMANFNLVLAAQETTWVRTFSLQIGIAPGTIIWGPKPAPNFPAAGFIYGIAYDRTGNNVYVADGWGRNIYRYSSDSFVTYQGTYAAPDTNCTDVTYSKYDDRLYVTSFNLKQVWKINKTTGAIIRQFASPSIDYPVGLALRPPNTMWFADRRTTLGATQLIYIGDTLGNATQYNSPVQGYYNSRCLAYDSLGNTFVEVQTWFDATGMYIDSVGVVEFANSAPPTPTGRRFKLSPGWNMRGIEADPRDGNYWITIPQLDFVYVQDIVKVKGFYTPALAVEETKDQIGNRNLILSIKPNPATVNVLFTVNCSSVACVKIFDLTGRLLNSYALNAGLQTIKWNRRDSFNRVVGDGVYFVRLEGDDGTSTGKFILTR